MKLALLLTGDELMAGDIIDSNSAEVAQMLMPLGIRIHRKVTIGDDRQQLLSQIRTLSTEHDVLIINGGLGPTQDDLTAELLAEAAGVPTEEHPDAVAHIHEWCERRGLELSPANWKQVILPRGCDIIPNETGSAVGFELELNDCRVMATPGVPSELRLMMKNAILPSLQASNDAQRLRVDKWQTFGLGESRVQQMIHDTYPNWPKEVDIGFRASMPNLEIKLISKGEHATLHEQCRNNLLALLGDNIYCEGTDSLAKVVVDLLTAKGQTVATAESCTGGMIASNITGVAGASAVFEAGFVTYSNRMKTELLGVSETSLIEHGAVSEAVVREMVTGALSRSGADYAVAVSGIAGPDGGTEEKPVGTYWVAWGRAGHIRTSQMRFRFGRAMFQRMVATVGLDLLRREIAGLEPEPQYFQRYK